MRSDKGFESIIFHFIFSNRIVSEFGETGGESLCCKLKYRYLNFDALASTNADLERI